MNNLTKEKIEKVVDELTINVSKNIHQNFLESMVNIPDNERNNPVVYVEMGTALSISICTELIKETLYQLLLE